MNIVLILVPITLVLVTIGILVFNWAVKNGQYDDLEGPAHRILYDDDEDMIPDDAKQPADSKPSTRLSRNGQTVEETDDQAGHDDEPTRPDRHRG